MVLSIVATTLSQLPISILPVRKQQARAIVRLCYDRVLDLTRETELKATPMRCERVIAAYRADLQV